MDRRLRNAVWVAKRLRTSVAKDLRQQDLIALASCLQAITVRKGSVLFRPGESPSGVWILRTGAVELAAGSGKSRCIVQIMRTGDMVGDVYLILGIQPPFAARTLEESHCLFVTPESLKDLLERRPSLALLWLGSVSFRLVTSRRRLLEVLAKTLPERVARLLTEESSGGCVRLPQRAIADMLGVQRSSVNKVLREFQSIGLIELGYGRILFRNRQALKLIASGAQRGGGLSATSELPYRARTASAPSADAFGLK